MVGTETPTSVDDAGTEIASGTIVTGLSAVDEICIPGDGTYYVYVGVAPATPGSWQSEISWTLTSAETGFVIASGGAPYILQVEMEHLMYHFLHILLLFIEMMLDCRSDFCCRIS